MLMQNVQILEMPTHFLYIFCSAFKFCVEMTCNEELVVGVCLKEGPEASLNGTEDHEFSVFRPRL